MLFQITKDIKVYTDLEILEKKRLLIIATMKPSTIPIILIYGKKG